MSFEEKILEMQKDNCTLYTILKYLRGYDCYKLLDEQILLCEILLIYKKHDIKVSKFQIRYCFNKSYNFEAHGDKNSYLAWIYRSFEVKPSKNTAYVQTSGTKSPFRTFENGRLRLEVQEQLK